MRAAIRFCVDNPRIPAMAFEIWRVVIGTASTQIRTDFLKALLAAAFVVQVLRRLKSFTLFSEQSSRMASPSKK
jgi:hypothetical protein